jgi:hypothetical protein
LLVAGFHTGQADTLIDSSIAIFDHNLSSDRSKSMGRGPAFLSGFRRNVSESCIIATFLIYGLGRRDGLWGTLHDVVHDAVLPTPRVRSQAH